ncbi:MAG: fasciclin domain-containing protein [Candidatus Poseidoniaceae archaeon]
MQRKTVTMLVALLMLSAIPLNVSADENDDIPTNAASTGVHDSLVAALAHADLVTTLQGDGPFTVFAPTDDAFAAAGIDLTTFDTDEENATLSDILLYHVYSGAVNAADVTDGLTVTMVNGDEASFTVTNGTVMIGDATVTTADVTSSNGIIHVIDTVLMPPADPVTPDIPTVASSTGVHTSLVAAVVQAGLLETLQGDGPFTVFAPTDQAFVDAGVDLADFDGDEGVAALANILAYHVTMGAVTSDALTDGMSITMLNQDETTVNIDSDGVMINDANVTAADVLASNGVIHVIDKVLMPAMGPEGEICYNVVTHSIVAGADQSTCESYMYVEDYEVQGQTITGCYNTVNHQVTNVSSAICGGYMWTPSVSIAMTAAATTIHNSLVAALTQANLVATLSGEDNYTVFAPTDEAFADAGIDLSTFTTDEEISALADILLYHVVPGKIMSSDLSVGMTNVTAANGDSLMVQVTDSGVMVGAEMAMVTLADVPASNGVIHVIDKVLMPPADEVVTSCDVTIGISSDGYAFSPASVTIQVNQTVCWQWTDAEMAHNVKEVDGMKSTTYVTDGITSGAPGVNVDFSHTFTEDTVFYYVCEPHMSLDMFGKVTVGDGGIVAPVVSDDKEEENTPGFLGVTMILATLGAVLYSRSNRDEEL